MDKKIKHGYHQNTRYKKYDIHEPYKIAERVSNAFHSNKHSAKFLLTVAAVVVFAFTQMTSNPVSVTSPLSVASLVSVASPVSFCQSCEFCQPAIVLFIFCLTSHQLARKLESTDWTRDLANRIELVRFRDLTSKYKKLPRRQVAKPWQSL